MKIRLKHIFLFALLFSLEFGFGQTISENYRLKKSRLLLGSNANMLKKGDKLFYNINIVDAAIDFGVTKNITIGGGLLYFPGYLLGQLKFKVGHSFSENVHGALVGNLFVTIFSNDVVWTPIYALTTLDFDKFSLTIGPGVILDTSEDLTLSGQLAFVIPFRKKLAFISENYWGDAPRRNYGFDHDFLLNLGVRLFHKKWFFDFGVSNIYAISGDGNNLFSIPTLSASCKF